ncbi:MAG: molybdopterin-dependent oxidoreductase [Rhodocyclaceae bacterium]|nr:molybdopterin-dependent oxidoreductase [Rhodocyclaceae bacterium]
MSAYQAKDIMAETKSTCCYCGVGCGVIIEHEAGQITGVRGDPDHPANFGRLCTKGSTLHLTAAPETLPLRALYPELRTGRGLPRERTSWDTALNHAADQFARVIREHGPDAVAFYISGQLLTEDYYVFNKLAKGLIGTNNVDTNSRLCMSSAVAGYKATLGADAPPTCYEDLDTDCLFITGSNTAFAHPIVFRRIEDAKAANPDMKIIVADPRRTDTAELADLYLPLLPGSDIALYNAMLHVMLWEDLIDEDYIRAHTTGFAELKAIVREYSPEAMAAVCGVPAADITTAARIFAARGKRTVSLWCQGLNQSAHGTHNNAALIHLHLATGKIGTQGNGPFSLTGQPNAMGGREVGGMATLLSGHRELANPEHRAEVARLWGLPDVPATPGLSAVELFKAVGEGRIKALWIACTNPAQSMPEINKVVEAFDTCEFVVVQEAYNNTDTTDLGDLILPAASWGEKEGTVTNSERRITRVRQAVPAPGETRPDWQIMVDFAHRLGKALGKAELAQQLFPYTTPESVFNEHRESTRGRDLDITGISYAMLENAGPKQWPLREGEQNGKSRLYADGIFATPDGKARFLPTRHIGTVDVTDARFPLRLTTGRLRDQWHGMSRTGSVARLYAHEREAVIELNRTDMQRRDLKDGDLVKAANKRGKIVVRVRASDSLRPGLAFMAMHWGRHFMDNGGANVLMPETYDPTSKQPELKHTSIRVEKFDPKWRLVAMCRVAPGADAAEVMARLPKLQAWLPRFAHATLGLAGRDTAVIVLRAWMEEPMAAEDLADLDSALGLQASMALRLDDPGRGIQKRAMIASNTLTVVRLAGEVAASDWLEELMATGASTAEARKWLLAPLSRPPVAGKSRGRIVCNCYDVSESEILAEYKTGCDLKTLQERKKCGTSCGSCVPELKRLAHSAAA